MTDKQKEGLKYYHAIDSIQKMAIAFDQFNELVEHMQDEKNPHPYESNRLDPGLIPVIIAKIKKLSKSEEIKSELLPSWIAAISKIAQEDEFDEDFKPLTWEESKSVLKETTKKISDILKSEAMESLIKKVKSDLFEF